MHWCARSVCLLFLFLQGTGYGGPIIEQFGRIELNWTTQRIRFYGYGDEGVFGASDAAAWKDGLAYLVEHLPKISQLHDSVSSGMTAARNVASSTYRVKTVYYANGAVKILMESQLSRALGIANIPFRVEEPEPSGMESKKLVVSIDKEIKPSGRFKIIAGGEVVYSSQHVTRKSFERGLMGAFWGRDGVSNAPFRTNEVIEVRGKLEDGQIVVPRSEWEEALQGRKEILSRSNVVISFPVRG